LTDYSEKLLKMHLNHESRTLPLAKHLTAQNAHKTRIKNFGRGVKGSQEDIYNEKGPIHI
jgi:hypothetical protein